MRLTLTRNVVRSVFFRTVYGLQARLVNSACSAVASFVLSSIQKDEDGISVSAVKAGLYNFVSKLGIAGLRVRNTDVRFLSLAVTRAHDLGELAEITPARIAPYLQDLVILQLDGRQYNFAAKEEGKKNK